jgi:hypothetical protein
MHSLKPRRRLKLAVKDSLRFILRRTRTNVAINKAIAYHAFNTYGFALLFEHTREHAFWSSRKFRKILRFLESDLYLRGLDCFLRDLEPDGVRLPFSKYGYAYNPPGIEVAYTVQSFPKHFRASPEAAAREWMNRQLAKTFNRDTGLMELNTDDPVTLAARIYELARLNNYRLA